MTRLPQEFTNRWENRREDGPGEGTVYWHILLRQDPEVRAIVKEVQDRLADFSGFHLTPAEWLHITTLIAGPADEITDDQLEELMDSAASLLSGMRPIAVTLGRILYHPEALVLAVNPRDALLPIYEAATDATRSVVGRESVEADSTWIPHVTFSYSTAFQPAAPIISALGRELPATRINIDSLSLVVQRGPERSWDWHEIGTVSFG